MKTITLNKMLCCIYEQQTHLKKAKAIIKDLLKYMPKENVEGIYEVTEAAEQFLREVLNE